MTQLNLGLGSPAPPFWLPSVVGGAPPRWISLEEFRGDWLALIFYPRDFSFVCPTELAAFSGRAPDFHDRQCRLLAISPDDVETHQRWLETPASEGGVGRLRFPLASDLSGAAAKSYGVWEAAKQVVHRGLFLIDPDGVIQYAVVHALSVGRPVDEVLRVLDGLQSGGMCPASWTSADGTLDVDAMLQPGRVLGHYRVEAELGRGGSGVVLRALDLKLNRRVAVKILNREIRASRKLLLSEARSAAAINHPNVCTVFAAEEIDGLPVVIMELLDGRTLHDLIAGGISPRQAEITALRIARGLAAAHAQRIVHGDLKPSNILLTQEGQPVIADFGLARSHHRTELEGAGDEAAADSAADHGRAEAADVPPDGDDPSLQSTWEHPQLAATASAHGRRGITGTPAYMSPEQARGERASLASDVFSLGLIILELLTGRRGLRQETLPGILAALRDPRLPQELTRRVPEPRRELLQDMLQLTPAARPTIDDVIQRWNAVRPTA